MKKLLIVLALFSLSCIPAVAQDVPLAEVFGGYQLVYHTGDEGEDGMAFHGFAGAAEANINETFSIVGELGTTFKSVSGDGDNVRLSNITFMAGPSVSYRAEKVRPFYPLSYRRLTLQRQ